MNANIIAQFFKRVFSDLIFFMCFYSKPFFDFHNFTNYKSFSLINIKFNILKKYMFVLVTNKMRMRMEMRNMSKGQHLVGHISLYILFKKEFSTVIFACLSYLCNLLCYNVILP